MESPEYQNKQRNLVEWDSKDLIILNQLNSPLTSVFTFMVESTMTGYILEFVSEKKQSTFKAKDKLRKGARGRLLKEVLL